MQLSDFFTRRYFKTTPDGRRLYFPWGFWGRGYLIPSDSDYERLRRQLTIYSATSFVVIVGAASTGFYIAAVIIAAICVAFYMVWSRFLLTGLNRTDERMSLREDLGLQANAWPTPLLWLAEIFALLFVLGGIVELAVDPHDRAMSLSAIVFFGVCAAAGAYMLILRRRASTTRS